jgi:hypothetical protein
MHSQLVGWPAYPRVFDYRNLPFGMATTFLVFSPDIAAEIVAPIVSTTERY